MIVQDLNFKKLQKLQSLFYGQEIVLTGGASHIEPAPDSFAYPVYFQANHHHKETGRKAHFIAVDGMPLFNPETQVVFFNVHSLELDKRELVKEARARDVLLVPFDTYRYGKRHPGGFLFEPFHTFCNETETRPTTGLSAFFLCLLFPIRSLFVTGFDFYEDEAHGIPYKRGPHHLEREFEFMRHKAKHDRRVILDSKLTDLFKEEKNRPQFIRTEIDQHNREWRLEA